MTIRAKLAAGLIAIAVVLLLPLVLALRSLERLEDLTSELRSREFAATLLLGRMRAQSAELREAETALLFVHTPAEAEAMDRMTAELLAQADSLRLYGLGTVAVDVREALIGLRGTFPDEYRAAAAQQTAVADSISSELVVPLIARVERLLASTEAPLRERAGAAVTAAAAATSRAERWAMIGLAVASLLALAIGAALWRAISRPVQELERGMREVAGGRFEHELPISPTRRDEFGQLAASFARMSQQLAQLHRLRAEFVSVASHELKTPINVIVGYVQLLREGIYGRVAPRQAEVLETVESQARGLARLVGQLLDVSRFEAGGGKLEAREMDLPRFLDELERTFRVLALQRDVRFEIDRGDGIPETVRWDRDRINEVLGNLLTNAFKFTDAGGQVTLGVHCREEGVVLTVRDTGAGIPPEQLPHVFEKFYQADNQASAAHGGTGLGLAIAQQIVVAHGGTIEVESEVGRGTLFTIVLPGCGQPAAPPAPRRMPAAAAVL